MGSNQWPSDQKPSTLLLDYGAAPKKTNGMTRNRIMVSNSSGVTVCIWLGCRIQHIKIIHNPRYFSQIADESKYSMTCWAYPTSKNVHDDYRDNAVPFSPHNHRHSLLYKTESEKCFTIEPEAPDPVHYRMSDKGYAPSATIVTIRLKATESRLRTQHGYHEVTCISMYQDSAHQDTTVVFIVTEYRSI